MKLGEVRINQDGRLGAIVEVLPDEGKRFAPEDGKAEGDTALASLGVWISDLDKNRLNIARQGDLQPEDIASFSEDEAGAFMLHSDMGPAAIEFPPGDKIQHLGTTSFTEVEYRPLL